MFNPEEAKYANGVLVELPYPTDDVRLMTKAAVDAVDRVFRPGFKYSKAEVLLVRGRSSTGHPRRVSCSVTSKIPTSPKNPVVSG